MARDLNELKKQVFFEMLDLAGRVFIVVRYAETVIIGNRGFLAEEKEKGLVLVFNRMMQFDWNESGIHATLGFGPKNEKCYVPPDEITAIFSPELSAQFITSSEHKELAEMPPKAAPEEKKPARPALKAVPGKKVVKVDFSKKK